MSLVYPVTTTGKTDGCILRAFLLLFWVVIFCSAATAGDDIFSRKRYPLLDNRIIESTDNVILRLGTVKKSTRNPLIVEDKPWEPRYDNPYAKVIYDEREQIFRLWVSVFIESNAEEATPREKRGLIDWRAFYQGGGFHRVSAMCYAESKDGINWNKPNLGQVEFQGNKNNNMVIAGPWHGLEVVIDPKDKDPDRRYKFIHPRMGKVWFSPDGKRIVGKEKEIGRIDDGDTHNSIFWDERIGKFVLFSRRNYYDEKKWRTRRATYTTSPDLFNWKKPPEVVLVGPDDNKQIHDFIVFPYEGVYVGLVGLFDVYSDRQYVQLVWSADCKNWKWIEPDKKFIENGRQMGDYDWGCIFPCMPIFMKDRIMLYYGASNNHFFDWRDGSICLATLRPDGFAGYEVLKAYAKYKDKANKKGTIRTKPVRIVGDKLHLTADVIPHGGFVQVSAFDEHNKKIARSKRFINTVSDGEVAWEGDFSLEKYQGKSLRFEFLFKSAKVYSFSF